jgi:ribosomal protein S12 methylthiotransferase
MKIGLVSLGCPKNLVDSEVMLGLAQQAGHELTPHASEADVLILELAAHKTNGACKRLVVTGCLGERYRDELRELIPEVDVVLGTGEIPAIVGAIGGQAQKPEKSAPAATAPITLYRRKPEPGASLEHIAARHREAAATRELPTYIYDADTPRVFATPRHYAYLKVAEGCDYACSFCIIPTLRGTSPT